MKTIENILRDLSFVQWDRFTSTNDDTMVTLYGWIDREKDAYKDFVVLFILIDEVNGFVTSSAKYTHEINKILGFETDDHNDCIRVESVYKNVPNVIHL